jgi:hypothetical protein
MTRKPVIYNGRPIGEASTWREVDELIAEQGRPMSGGDRVSEGPDGFHIETRRK